MVTGPRLGWESHGFGPPNALTFTLEDVKAKVEKEGSEFGELRLAQTWGVAQFEKSAENIHILRIYLRGTRVLRW